jgi:hypothetical protein
VRAPRSRAQTALAGTFWVALLVVGVRLAAIAVGSYAGCRAGAVRQEHRGVFWMSQITQVGGLTAVGSIRRRAASFSRPAAARCCPFTPPSAQPPPSGQPPPCAQPLLAALVP